MCLTLVCRLLLVLTVTGVFPLLLTGFSTTGTGSGSGSGAGISSEKHMFNMAISAFFPTFSQTSRSKRHTDIFRFMLFVLVNTRSQLTVLLVAVLVRICVAVLVTVYLGESCDFCWSFRLSWRLVQKLLQLLLIHSTGGGWIKRQERANTDKL